MSMNIYTVRQTTDNEHLWTILAQISDKTANQILSVLGTLSRTYDTDDLRLIQVAIA